MIRHIILEGPDGAGKSMLRDYLMHLFRVYPHGRASDSLNGPVPNLGEWHYKTMGALERTLNQTFRYVFDRHPLWSEPIYGPIARGKCQSPFDDSSWVNSERIRLGQTSVVVWCLPPLDVVVHNTSSDRDMPGVTENIHDLYNAYMELATTPQPYINITYNYTLPGAQRGLAHRLVSILDTMRSDYADRSVARHVFPSASPSGSNRPGQGH